MKKILSLALACILMLAILTPCLAAKKTDSTHSGDVILLGEWPQSRVTDIKEIGVLKSKLSANPAHWETDCLPDGRSIEYADVYFDASTGDLQVMCIRPTYRIVRIGGGAIQWYRWEPLTWERAKVGNVYVLICTSVVSVASYSGPNPVMKGDPNADAIYAWLTQDFYASAFSDSEKSAFMTVTLPLYSLTCGSAAAVGDYAALCGANGSSYLQMQLPDETAQETEKTTPAFVQTQTKGSPAKAKQISIRPMLIEIEIEGGGLINFLRRLFGW